jgi:hypothetical protein
MPSNAYMLCLPPLQCGGVESMTSDPSRQTVTDGLLEGPI